MRSINGLVALAAASVASAAGLTVPPYFQDGFYTFDIDTANVTNFKPFTDAVAPADAMRKVKRSDFPPNRRVGCTDHRVPQNGNEHAAWEKLNHFCEGGSKIWTRSGHFAKVGQAVWYVCNYANNDQWCNFSEMDQAGGILNGECRDQGGWVGIDDWAKMYGREAADVGICNDIPVSDG